MNRTLPSNTNFSSFKAPLPKEQLKKLISTTKREQSCRKAVLNGNPNFILPQNRGDQFHKFESEIGFFARLEMYFRNLRICISSENIDLLKCSKLSLILISELYQEIKSLETYLSRGSTYYLEKNNSLKRNPFNAYQADFCFPSNEYVKTKIEALRKYQESYFRFILVDDVNELALCLYLGEKWLNNREIKLAIAFFGKVLNNPSIASKDYILFVKKILDILKKYSDQNTDRDFNDYLNAINKTYYKCLQDDAEDDTVDLAEDEQ